MGAPMGSLSRRSILDASPCFQSARFTSKPWRRIDSRLGPTSASWTSPQFVIPAQPETSGRNAQAVAMNFPNRKPRNSCFTYRVSTNWNMDLELSEKDAMEGGWEIIMPSNSPNSAVRVCLTRRDSFIGAASYRCR